MGLVVCRQISPLHLRFQASHKEALCAAPGCRSANFGVLQYDYDTILQPGGFPRCTADRRTAVKISVRKRLMTTNFSVHCFSWLEGLMLYPAQACSPPRLQPCSGTDKHTSVPDEKGIFVVHSFGRGKIFTPLARSET